MTALQKGTLWMVGILAFVFALSIGLSWYSFGFLDWSTVTTMGLMLLPVLSVATIVLLWSERSSTVTTTEPEDLRNRAGAENKDNGLRGIKTTERGI